MGIFSGFGETFAKVATSLKDTFLPTAAVSAERRKDVFGTESKAVVGSVIVGGAAAAIAAPAVIAAAGGISAVARTAATAFSNTSLSTKAITAIAAPVAVGAIIKEGPKAATKTAASIVNFESNLIKVGGSSSVKELGTNIKNTVKDNPYISLGAGLLAVSATGAGVGSLINAYNTNQNTEALKAGNKLLQSSMDNATDVIGAYIPTAGVGAGVGAGAGAIPDLPKVPTAKVPASPVPITPETQIIGKQATSTTTTKRKKASSQSRRQGQSQSLRISIFNQSKLLNMRRSYGYA
jgi:hypothetical protein